MLGAVMVGIFSVMVAMPVMAVSCGGVETTVISCDENGGISSILGVVINIMMGLMTILAVIGITVTGIQYLTASGDEAKATKAKRRMFEIVIGLVAGVMVYGVVNFLMPNGVTETMEQLEQTDAEIAEQRRQEEQRRREEEQRRQEEQNNNGGNNGGGNNGNNGDNGNGGGNNTPQPATTVSVTVTSPSYNNHSYHVTTASAGAVPFVYAPNNGYGQNLTTVYTNLRNTQTVAVINAGTFNMGVSTYPATGSTIMGGQVITSGDGCNMLVIDRNGLKPGWADYGTSAAELASGTASYHDIHGNTVTGTAVYSLVTCFSPVLIDGKTANGSEISYNFSATTGHYSAKRARQMLCVKETGGNLIYAFISNAGEGNNGGWNFSDMAAVSKENNCTFSYNLDGGGSVLLGTRSNTTDDFTKYGFRRTVPTFLLFTTNNQLP